MIQAGHKEHHQQTEAVNDGAEETCGSMGFNEQQHDSGNSKQRTDTMGDSVANLFQNGAPGRLIQYPGVLSHHRASCKNTTEIIPQNGS